MIIKLPTFLKPLHYSDLIRVGKNNDGGYVISKKSLLESECLMSLGLNNDCSFEEEFKRYNNCEIFSYDNTVHIKFWLKKIATDFFNLFFFDFKNFIRENHIYLFYKYLKFYNKKSNFHFKKNITNNGFYGSKVQKSNSIDFVDAFNFINKKNVFLKIDIEGYEYRILDQILEIQNKISGLVIEFHDCDLNINRIESFIKNFDLKLVHIHHNNWSSVTNKGLPVALELSFTTNKNIETKKTDLLYPSKYDQPNNPDLKDLEIQFDEN